MTHSFSFWLSFTTIIISLIIVDLVYFSKNNSLKKSIFVSLIYITIACLYGVYIYLNMGSSKASEYYTGFFIEKAMALDNIFIFSIIFKFLHIPIIAQHRILFWGIVGVLLFRGVMIFCGAAIINQYSWILYFLAIILIFTGVKIFTIPKHSFNIEKSWIYKLLTSKINFLPVTDRGFLVKENGKIYATSCLLALLLIEGMDIVFAIDSVPAIFAITNDIFIIYTSNIFAIIGLRSLYTVLAEITRRFSYLKYSLALILIFIGIKILLSNFYHISSLFSLVITLILLFGGILLSIKNKTTMLEL